MKATLGALIKAGARPFIVPAMGSHGGATAEGQAMVLAEYGITPESMGVPIEASMEVRKIGTAFDELDVVFSVPAFQADGVVVINRVKPHTDFHATHESGVLKMLVIGLGKREGASQVHKLSFSVRLRSSAASPWLRINAIRPPSSRCCYRKISFAKRVGSSRKRSPCWRGCPSMKLI